ncbi:DUF930 domain-containing protein [Stappia sp.]|uniref:DUF930 domain-containing protein n=1 Tax=Stappia sp. TaxID=1870903 RepID=UPI003A99C0A5
MRRCRLPFFPKPGYPWPCADNGTSADGRNQTEQRPLTLDTPSDKREPGFAVHSPDGGTGEAAPSHAPLTGLVPGLVARRDEPGGAMDGEVEALPQAEERGTGDRLPASGPAGAPRAAIALSLLLHVAVAWAVFFGGDSIRDLPAFLDEPVEVVLVDFPAEDETVQEEETEEEPPVEETPEEEEAEEEAAAVPPPPLSPPPLPESEQAEAEPPAAEEPEDEKPETSEPEIAALPEPAVPPQATPRVLIPVTEFAEEDSGSEEQAGEIGLREGAEETSGATSEEPPAQTPAEADEEAPGAPGAGPGDGDGEGPNDGPGEGPAEGEDSGAVDGEDIAEAARDGAAEEVAPGSEIDSESESEAEADSEAGTEVATLGDLVTESEADTAGELDVLGGPGEAASEAAAETPASDLPAADTRVLPREKPAGLTARTDLSALADLGARAEAVSRALATRRLGGGGGGGGSDEIAGGTPATRLFSRDISDDPRMRMAMNGMPQAARADLLCMTELRAQLRTGTPPYHADLLPSFRLEAGNVLQPRRAAFRAGGQWYDLAFRCELNAGVTRVESFSHRVGEPVPRSEWSARRFPGN